MESDNESGMDKDKKSSSPAYPNAYKMPRGIEVLVKKASVDPKFRSLLLEKRAEAALEIDLELDEAEKAMVAAMPQEQLEKIIVNTKVPEEQKPVFMSELGKVMLLTVITGSVILSGLLAPSFGHTLNPEQYDRIMQRQKEQERQIRETNEPNHTDLKAEEDSNEQ